MDINQLLDELYSYSMHGIKLGLSNIEKLCEEMGNPEKDYKVIHVGGTNGKGSTSTTIETVLIENGNSVGKYTSPHILKFNERIRVNGEDISDSEIAYYYKIVKEAVNKIGITPTFFEVTTAMMFKYFSDKKIEYAIVEVGLGGKYDATNVVLPEMVVITNVSLDHTEFLGNNVYEISKEKAGIIKNGADVVVSSLDLDFITAI
ncbi:MAG: Mur ligase family protein, partial [Cetobacterium sp.]